MADMNYNHLRYFWAVAHDGNLTRTAGKLNLSQSALSVQIRKLEDRLGHALFERRGRQLHLTEAGRITLDYADTIFDAGKDLLGTLSQQGRPRQVLRVGALATLSRNFQIEFLRPLLGQADVELVLRSGTLVELLQSLETLSLDVVLTNRAPAHDAMSNFTSQPISDQPVSLIGRPSRLSGNTPLTTLLRDNPIIVPTEDSPVRAGFDRFCAREGIEPTLAAEVDDVAMMRLLTRENIGLGVLPPIAVQNELQSGMLVECQHQMGLAESFHAVTVARKFPNPLLGQLLESDH
ncbi:LysR family transcriptional regulator [Roseobacter sp. CCS2]|uniref:LysR family transcriptional regulator n=1 Tax=Roseobacter sp. CCS2 TaxID=391593 RepID=UPI0000F3E4DE|nr:LysR family transcriptional regulator [Roseobacter sp. CCS2]EBA12133.1 transcriptional regulator lysR family, putative [Roseobacter sp. CCS2]